MSARRVYCSTFPDARDCCASCHEDHDEMGYDLMEALEGIGEVCCAVHQWIEENPEEARRRADEKLRAV